MLRIARRLVVMLGLMLLAACQNLQVPAAELPDDGPPIAVSSEAALSFINKSTTAAQSAAAAGGGSITISQEEVTSFIAIGAQLAEQAQQMGELENLEQIGLNDLDRLEEIAREAGIENTEEFRRLQEARSRLEGLPDLNLPSLSLRLALKEPQIYFRQDGNVIIRGYGEVRGRRQPIRIVAAPRASQGELVLDFVEGQLGPVPLPERVFDVIGKGVARVLLAGQEYVEITEITVGDGIMTIGGRRG